MTQQYGELWNNQEAPSIRGVGVPRSATVEISGTKMRKYLCDGDLESFGALLPPLPDQIKTQIASILADSASCGIPLKKRNEKNESILRSYIRSLLTS